MRNLLAPIAIVYGTLLKFRHWLYNHGIISSYQAPVFTLCIGNLELGGTGKTPHAAYFLENFLDRGEKPAFLSRGYHRNTSGFQLVHLHSNYSEVGDEPLWIKNQFPQIPVVVCENREEGIKTLLKQFPDTTLVILDDAFQHRSIKSTLSLLLTPGDKPFWKNKLVPWGSLRDVQSASKRAQIILKTKCRKGEVDSSYFGLPVYTSFMEFGTPYEAKTGKPVDMAAFSEWTAFCGIAKPDDFFKACKKCLNQELETRSYPDHYAFTVKDLKELKEKAEKQKSRLITTEKDWMRIKNVDTVDLKNLYILPMKVKILQEKEVWNQIFQSLQSFRQSNGI